MSVGNLRMFNGWNVDLITGLFLPEEVSLVLSIPFTRASQADTLIWNFSTLGEYLVKSGYKLVLPNFVESEATATSPIWAKLWQLDSPPKVKHWLWRACRILLDGSATNFSDTLLGFIDRRIDDQCLLFATSFLREWNNMQIDRSNSSVSSALVPTWAPPPTGVVKSNVDAAVHMTEGRSSYAGLIRNEVGQFLVACTGHHFEGVLVETDCLRLFQAVTTGFDSYSDWAPVLEEIKQLLSQISSSELVWVQRQGNMPAHALARMTCLHPCFRL
ncbi:uncharacterized protein LOC105643257 [Jatropha curcas]|uniref:uncharacterized protein LOC105643257 n=1 Tax=Jatropha curcas TaxID=180498 RepID=UPI001893E2F8|nr:uncharacterized protein LOC105643257 [Jatropha curcas]